MGKWRERKNNKLMSSRCKSKEKITRLFNSTLSTWSKCRNRWFLWTVLEIFKIESNYSGRLSHVSSQPEMIPSSRSLLSRDKRLPLDTWNQSGLQENVLGNQFSMVDSAKDYSQRIQIWRRAKKPRSSSRSRKDEGLVEAKTDKIKAQIQCRHLRQGRWLWALQNRWNYRRSTVGQQRQQKSELQFDKFPNAQFFGVENSIQNTGSNGSDFPSEAMCWIKEAQLLRKEKPLRTGWCGS